jgi:hypothetical protein
MERELVAHHLEPQWLGESNLVFIALLDESTENIFNLTMKMDHMFPIIKTLNALVPKTCFHSYKLYVFMVSFVSSLSAVKPCVSSPWHSLCFGTCLLRMLSKQG